MRLGGKMKKGTRRKKRNVQKIRRGKVKGREAKRHTKGEKWMA
jgi:hypothetical protein